VGRGSEPSLDSVTVDVDAASRSGLGSSDLPVPRLIGTLVGATGGLVFVLANTHTPLDAAESVALRILAVVGLVALVALSLVAGRPFGGRGSVSEGRPASDEASWFGRRFWLIVAGELALFQVGFQLLRVLGAPPESRVAWIAFVVGLHFVAFARLWRAPGLAPPLGAAGLAMSATSAADWAPVVSGVVSGFVLLTGCLAAVIAVVPLRRA
jgi:hypothetical protein